MKKPTTTQARSRRLRRDQLAIARGGVSPVPSRDWRFRPEPTGEGDEQH